MSICAKRPEEVSFFTECKKCPCGEEVRAELAAQELEQEQAS